MITPAAVEGYTNIMVLPWGAVPVPCLLGSRSLYSLCFILGDTTKSHQAMFCLLFECLSFYTRCADKMRKLNRLFICFSLSLRRPTSHEILWQKFSEWNSIFHHDIWEDLSFALCMGVTTPPPLYSLFFILGAPPNVTRQCSPCSLTRTKWENWIGCLFVFNPFISGVWYVQHITAIFWQKICEWKQKFPSQ